MTAAEALARCLALGTSRANCEMVVQSNMVNGVYCDGVIVIDGGGHRCIPRAVIDRVNDARDADPLPDRPTLPAPASSSSGWWLVGVVVVVGAGVLLASRKG